MTIKEAFPPKYAAQLEEVLRRTALGMGLTNYEIRWSEHELNLYYRGVVCTGFDIYVNPLNGKILCELKPPQDLSALFMKGH